MRRFGLVLVSLLAAVAAGQGEAQQSGANVLQNVLPQSSGQPTGLVARRLPLTVDALQGPPNPATLYALTAMTDAQMSQYLAAYRAHMAASWSTRLATLSGLKMMDRAVTNSDEHAARYYYLLLDQLWARLRDLDYGFETALGSILKEHQLETFRIWRAAWEQGARAQQRLQVSLVDNHGVVR